MIISLCLLWLVLTLAFYVVFGAFLKDEDLYAPCSVLAMLVTSALGVYLYGLNPALFLAG